MGRPLPSGYGIHLVLVRERHADRPVALAEVRDAVRREWVDEQHADANARFYADLRKRYVVTIEHPPVSVGSGLAAGLRK